MNIWLLAVLLAWLPVSTVLAVLVGRTALHAERQSRQQRVLRRPRPGHAAPVVDITTARRHARPGRRSHEPHRRIAS